MSNEEYDDYRADAFINQVNQGSDKLVIAAIAAGGTIWGLSGAMLPGVLVGVGIMVYANRGVQNSNRALTQIHKNGMVAPFLEGDRFREFQQQFGDEVCVEQLKKAHSMKLEIRPEAENFLVAKCPELFEKTGKKASLRSQQQQLPQAPEPITKGFSEPVAASAIAPTTLVEAPAIAPDPIVVPNPQPMPVTAAAVEVPAIPEPRPMVATTVNLPSGFTPATFKPKDKADYLNNFLEYPALIFGGQGAGKTWTSRYIAAIKANAGHHVVVLDPHGASREWEGIQHIGSGMDYNAIADFLIWYLEEIQRRYKAFSESSLSEEEWRKAMEPGTISVICDEMTNWADRVPGKDLVASFFKSSITDSRKVLMPPMYIAHDRTLGCLGKADGLARLRDKAMLELELLAEPDPVTRRPVSSGKGSLKMPGATEWIPVNLPKIDQKITQFHGGIEAIAPTPKPAEPTTEADSEVVDKLEKRPDLPEEDINYMIKKLEGWLVGKGQSDVKYVYQSWNAYDRGLSRGNVRYLLNRVNKS